MAFDGFTKSDFDSFRIDTLAGRMEAIQTRIQPKFKAIGDTLTEDLSIMVGSEMHLHIARHARRTVNPPNDTWLAIAGNKRGYKKHPHFQVGLWDDRVFVWLAFIYELPKKTKIAQHFLDNIDTLADIIPGNYMISLDHMNKAATSLDEIDLHAALQRFHNVKKAELLIGQYFYTDDPILKDGDKFIKAVKDTYEKLIPIYRLAYK